MAESATEAVAHTPVSSPSGKKMDNSMTPSYVWVKKDTQSLTSHQAELLEILSDGYLVKWTMTNREEKISLNSLVEQDPVGRRRTRGRNRSRAHSVSSGSEEPEEEIGNDNDEDEAEAEEEEFEEGVRVKTKAPPQSSLLISSSSASEEPPPPVKKKRGRPPGSLNKEKKDKKKQKQQSKPKKANSTKKQMLAELDQEAVPPKAATTISNGSTNTAMVSLYQLHNIKPLVSARRVAQLLEPEDYYDTMPAAKFVTEFFLFIHERHLCWQRRNNDTNPQWSESSIMQNYNFANVYRALDRGTCYARYQFGQQYLALCQEQQQKQEAEQQKQKKKKNRFGFYETDVNNNNNEDNSKTKVPCTKLHEKVRRPDWIQKLLWTSYCYRQVNQIEPFLNYGGIPSGPKELSRFLEFVDRIEEEIEDEERDGLDETKFFAPSTTGTPSLLSFDDYKQHLQKVSQTNEWLLKKAADRLAKCKTLHDCWNQILTYMPGMKECPDIAWLVLCDLLETGCLLVKTMDLCYLSPESMRVLAPCWKDGSVDESRALSLVNLMTEKQDDIFEAVGVEFPAWDSRRLAEKDVAHCLSQYSKYLHIQSDMRRQLIGGGHRLLVSRSYLDVDKACRFCDTQTDDGLFCDACLCFYCGECEAESCEAPPEHWICRLCTGLDEMHFVD